MHILEAAPAAKKARGVGEAFWVLGWGRVYISPRVQAFLLTVLDEKEPRCKVLKADVRPRKTGLILEMPLVHGLIKIWTVTAWFWFWSIVHQTLQNISVDPMLPRQRSLVRTIRLQRCPYCGCRTDNSGGGQRGQPNLSILVVFIQSVHMCKYKLTVYLHICK